MAGYNASEHVWKLQIGQTFRLDARAGMCEVRWGALCGEADHTVLQRAVTLDRDFQLVLLGYITPLESLSLKLDRRVLSYSVARSFQATA